MEELIKEVIREMILDGEIDIALVNTRDEWYPAKHDLKLIVTKENKIDSGFNTGLDLERLVNWYKNEKYCL